MHERDARAALENLVIDFTDAFNRDDLDAVMDTFAEDGIYDEFNGARHHGKAQIRAAFEPQFTGAFGTVRFRTEDLIVDADTGKAMISWLCTLKTAKGPAGWRGLDILHFQDGKLKLKETYAKTKTPRLEASEA